jgi:hypothetical protein
MRWIGDALRGMKAALAAHPVMFILVMAGIAVLNVVAPVVVLSIVREPVDFFTVNPWLRRLPEYLASDEATAGVKLRKLSNLALFWFSSRATYGGADWGVAVDVGDVVRIFAVGALFGLYFALWRFRRDVVRGARASAAMRRGGVAGAAATVVGISTGACSVSGCGAPIMPVIALAFVGIESGTLHFLAESSRVATMALFAALIVAVVWLGVMSERSRPS